MSVNSINHLCQFSSLYCAQPITTIVQAFQHGAFAVHQFVGKSIQNLSEKIFKQFLDSIALEINKFHYDCSRMNMPASMLGQRDIVERGSKAFIDTLLNHLDNLAIQLPASQRKEFFEISRGSILDAFKRFYDFSVSNNHGTHYSIHNAFIKKGVDMHDVSAFLRDIDKYINEAIDMRLRTL